jgi:outer membrane protein assembly factor BamB
MTIVTNVSIRHIINMLRFKYIILFLLVSQNISLCQQQDTSMHDIKILIGTFLGNEKRNYYGNEAPDNLNIIWKHYLGKGVTVISRKSGERIWAGAGWTGQPLLIEEYGQLFLIQGAYDHNLKKINAANGGIVWQYAFDDVVKGTGTIWHNPFSQNSKSEYIIFQGSRLGVGNFLDARHVPSFRAISYLTGEELWRFDVKWTDSYSRDADGSALIINDTLYTGLENSLFTVLDPDPANAAVRDEMFQPAIIQEIKLYEKEDVAAHHYNIVTESSPCRLGNHIYIASGSGHVYGYNMGTKKLDWDFRTGSDMDGSAVVTDDNCLLVSIEKQFIAGHGGILKLDPSKDPENSVVWFFPTADSSFASWKGGVIGTACITDSYHTGLSSNFAAFTGIDGYLYVVDHRQTDTGKTVTGPDGKSAYPIPRLIFKKYIGPSISTPIMVNNKMIAAGYHGIYLFEFDREGNFNLLDRFSATFEATPVAWNGRIYIASRNGYLYCFGSK